MHIKHLLAIDVGGHRHCGALLSFAAEAALRGAFVLPVLTGQDPQPKGSYVAPSLQTYSGPKPPENTITFCFIYIYRVVTVIKKDLMADFFMAVQRG